MGSFYVSVKLFFVDLFKQVLNDPFYYNNYTGIYCFFVGGYGSCSAAEITFDVLFTWVYACLVIFSVIISLASPIEKAMTYFIVIASVMSFFTNISIIGIAFFLAKTGFRPATKCFHGDLWP